ncbi:hypothetical protein V7S43_018922 [Phytophthora oleae]|uniref:Uncharacterized protein n=1 Tax=Phytophthora oleae TaxID=2107226 RepID=A0ABD3EPD1_9STRA
MPVRHFESWKDPLQTIYGMDFRDLGVIDKLMDHVEETFGSLDILASKPTQTTRRSAHYKHLVECDVAPVLADMAMVNEMLRGNVNLIGSISLVAYLLHGRYPAALTARWY